MTINILIDKLQKLREFTGDNAEVNVRNPAGDHDRAEAVEADKHVIGSKVNWRVYIDV